MLHTYDFCYNSNIIPITAISQRNNNRIRDDTHMKPMKIVQFSRPTTSPYQSTSEIPPPPLPWTSNFKRNPPLQMITNQLKENMTQAWLLYPMLSTKQLQNYSSSSVVTTDTSSNGALASISAIVMIDITPSSSFSSHAISFSPQTMQWYH